MKKDAEKYVPKTGILGNATDYHIYHLSNKEKLIGFGIGLLGAVVVGFVFFRSILICAVAGVAVGVKTVPLYRNYLKKKRLKALLFQFKDFLESLTSSYSVGKNTMEAFSDAYIDLQQIYGDAADIVKELAIILNGMQNNINIEKLLSDFADRSDLDDVKSFADVFEVSLRQGANIKNIIASTRDIISDKIEIEMEINTLLAGNKNELNIMMLMPLIIMLSLGGLGSDMTLTENTPLNILIKIFVLGIFAAAYAMGKKFTNIKL